MCEPCEEECEEEPSHLHEEDITLQVKRGQEIIMRQLAMMDRSRQQLKTALTRRGISEDVAEALLDKFHEHGLVDDKHFAEVFVRSRIASRAISRRALLMELGRKGVARELAEEAVSQLDPEDEAEAAYALAKKKLQQASGNPRTLEQRTYALLARRGFSPSQCRLALKRAQSELEREEINFDEGLLD